MASELAHTAARQNTTGEREGPEISAEAPHEARKLLPLGEGCGEEEAEDEGYGYEDEYDEVPFAQGRSAVREIDDEVMPVP
jgi:hypothetical protein